MIDHQLRSAVERFANQASRLLSDLIRLPTLPGREQHAIELMRDWFERAGFACSPLDARDNLNHEVNDMAHTVTLQQVEELAAQLSAQEKQQLIADVTDWIRHQDDDERVRRERLLLAEALLAEVADIEDDSKGDFDAVEDVRLCREEREAKICRSGA